jgi:hypothetical protein
MINFDNRGSKVMSDKASAKIMAVLAKYVFMVPESQVFQVRFWCRCRRGGAFFFSGARRLIFPPPPPPPNKHTGLRRRPLE